MFDSTIIKVRVAASLVVVLSLVVGIIVMWVNAVGAPLDEHVADAWVFTLFSTGFIGLGAATFPYQDLR